MFEHRRRRGGNRAPFVVSLLLFAGILILILLTVTDLSENDDGARTLREAIERASILCYASEGFFPESLSYIEEYYGVQISTSPYIVEYDVHASNLMPRVRVFRR